MGLIIITAVLLGGLWILNIPFIIWYVCPTLDAVLCEEQTNVALSEKDIRLQWHRLNLILWPILRFLILFELIAFNKAFEPNAWEISRLFFTLG